MTNKVEARLFDRAGKLVRTLKIEKHLPHFGCILVEDGSFYRREDESDAYIETVASVERRRAACK